MNDIGLAQQLAFVLAQRNQDEATVLALAVREGIRALYQETLMESYLLGRVPRERLVEELGPEEVETIDNQRDAFGRDVRWGMARG